MLAQQCCVGVVRFGNAYLSSVQATSHNTCYSFMCIPIRHRLLIQTSRGGRWAHVQNACELM